MTTSSSRSLSQRPLRKYVFQLGLAAGLVAMSSGSLAWGVAFEINPAVWFNSIMNQINTLTQKAQDYAAYYKQAQDIKRQADHFKSLYTKLQSAMMLQSYAGDKFEPVKETDGMAQACPGTQTNILDITKLMTPDLTGESVVDKQLELCQRIQLAKNRKYNLTVNLMKRLADNAKEYKELEKKRMGAAQDQQGELNGALANLQSFSAKFDQEMQTYEMSVKAYDNYIAALNDRQQLLARQALDSKKQPLGTVLQGAMLKSALEVARKRER